MSKRRNRKVSSATDFIGESFQRNLSGVDIAQLMTAYWCVEEEMIKKYKWYFHYVVGYPSGCVNAHTHGVADHFGHMDLQITLPIAQSRIQGIFNTVMDRIKSGDRFVDGQIADRILREPCKVKFVLAEDGDRAVMRIILPDPEGNLDREVMEGVYAIQYDALEEPY